MTIRPRQLSPAPARFTVSDTTHSHGVPGVRERVQKVARPHDVADAGHEVV